MDKRKFVIVFILVCSFLQIDTVNNVQAAEAVSKIVNYEIVNRINSKSIPKSLTGRQGSPDRGEELMVDRRKGNCLSCHRIGVFEERIKDNPAKYGDMGEIGPVLDGVATRYEMGVLRLMLVDAKEFFPETIMPSFYKVRGLVRVSPQLKNKPILTAQEIEDVLSFLINLE